MDDSELAYDLPRLRSIAKQAPVNESIVQKICSLLEGYACFTENDTQQPMENRPSSSYGGCGRGKGNRAPHRQHQRTNGHSSSQNRPRRDEKEGGHDADGFIPVTRPKYATMSRSYDRKWKDPNTVVGVSRSSPDTGKPRPSLFVKSKDAFFIALLNVLTESSYPRLLSKALVRLRTNAPDIDDGDPWTRAAGLTLEKCFTMDAIFVDMYVRFLTDLVAERAREDRESSRRMLDVVENFTEVSFLEHALPRTDLVMGRSAPVDEQGMQDEFQKAKRLLGMNRTALRLFLSDDDSTVRRYADAIESQIERCGGEDDRHFHLLLELTHEFVHVHCHARKRIAARCSLSPSQKALSGGAAREGIERCLHAASTNDRLLNMDARCRFRLRGIREDFASSSFSDKTNVKNSRHRAPTFPATEIHQRNRRPMNEDKGPPRNRSRAVSDGRHFDR